MARSRSESFAVFYSGSFCQDIIYGIPVILSTKVMTFRKISRNTMGILGCQSPVYEHYKVIIHDLTLGTLSLLNCCANVKYFEGI